MRRMPNILMAGASGRNLGKTEFLCRTIAAQSKRLPVTAIKVSTIDETDVSNHSYRKFEGAFSITRETASEGNKDTQRMIRAGAAAVYWLRVQRSSLEDGLNELFSVMQADGIHLKSDCIVMESGGARAFIDQSLFLMIHSKEHDLKPSALETMHLTDRTLNFYGDGWDVNPETLSFNNGRWGLKEEAAALIMSGGQSRRMGRDKSIMPIHGRPMISSVIDQLQPNFESVILSGAKEKYAFTGCPVVEDLIPDNGPLMGLLSTLKASGHELNFITACDIPDINLPLTRRMLSEIGNYDAVVPVVQGAQKQPLFAVYRKSVTSEIEQLIKEGRRSLHALLDRLNVHYLETNGHWYHNLNTPDDLERYRKTAS